MLTYRLEHLDSTGEGQFAGIAGVREGYSNHENIVGTKLPGAQPKSLSPASTDEMDEDSPESQTPANPRTDPWDLFLENMTEEAENGAG